MSIEQQDARSFDLKDLTGSQSNSEDVFAAFRFGAEQKTNGAFINHDRSINSATTNDGQMTISPIQSLIDKDSASTESDSRRQAETRSKPQDGVRETSTPTGMTRATRAPETTTNGEELAGSKGTVEYSASLSRPLRPKPTENLKDRLDQAHNPDADPEVLARLARDPNRNVRFWVAYNPHTPPDVLSRFARLPGPENAHMRRAVAFNPSTAPEDLTFLARDPDASVRRVVAENRHTPPQTLARLARDSDYMVRSEVGGNLSTPVATLTELAGHHHSWRDDQVRAFVAGNRSTLPAVLSRLSSDSEPTVRLSVAGNRSTPVDVVRRLSWDSNRAVLQTALCELLDRKVPIDKK